ncbi:hypothetical protein NBRC10512_007925 [Rhodotorula toruloides]|uniref:Sulfhydryl oxidase n=2 Tax=Rhodotorula toruloides TaxID=5286 RepID=A0A061AQ66_RHOTO|nr:FAD dependent sulfhydryl oxidase Erv2 [Rhodotorula toruloides NP11]EMS20555.1 FAD dependent sulfhydryl oxidase Erv2 [Rhodotorula toruloides NP11]KAJ8296957.1 FAD-linked sulfhydryl oxidase ERV2 [Rhodotorula toruloides]CDR39306.1 RHTO0S04e03752g1_1 [Rhodotorula toruloides]
MIRLLSQHRFPLAIVGAALILLVLSALALRSSFDSPDAHNALWAPGSVGLVYGSNGRTNEGREAFAQTSSKGWEEDVADSLKHGDVIMPKLGNATAKAELGRASWKLLHTMAARFPEKPTENERDTFKSFLYLFSRLYPCGECAAEFQQLLKKHPPQTSSRGSASLYLCHLHNLVNLRLGKPEFDCGVNLRDVYDCGCADDEDEEGRVGGKRREEKEEGRNVIAATPQGERRDPDTGLELVGG